MFKRLHLCLTLLCAGVTSLILVVMSLTYLHISEEVLEKNEFLSFQENMRTLIANLENQDIISYELLFKLESNNHYYICLLDNGQPYLFNSLQDDPVRKTLLEESMQYFEQNRPSDMRLDVPIPDNTSLHTEYTFYSRTAGTKCQASAVFMGKNSGILQIFVLSPMQKLNAQIKAQELLFFIIDCAALLLLFIFSWIFTKILLKPIENSQKQQMQFITDASHELRTPLSVILSCADACSMATPQETGYFLSTIRSEGLRMSSLLEDLLMLGRSDSHMLTYRMEPVELDTLLLSSYEAFETMAKHNHISLSVSLPMSDAAPCRCDSNRISQVLAILLHNAVCYTPGGGSIRLSLEESDGTAQLCVSDSGVGIPDKDKKNVFKRFYRSEKARNTKGHFGLGLSIAYEIVKAHKGSIKLTDTPGGGSTFTVQLPL